MQKEVVLLRGSRTEEGQDRTKVEHRRWKMKSDIREAWSGKNRFGLD